MAHASGDRSARFKAGAGATGAYRADVRNVHGLALEAYERGCEMLVFLHDHDDDDARKEAIERALRELTDLRFGDDFRYELAVVEGQPRPEIEGWVLCLMGAHGTDSMSSAKVERELAAAGITSKATADYVAIAESKDLPTQPCSLRTWLDDAEATFARLIDGNLKEA